MTKILALSGKKQAGKNASANFLFGIEMVALGETDEAFVDREGQLRVLSDIRENENDPQKLAYCVFKPDDRNPVVRGYLHERVWPVIKQYSFADWLKLIAHEVLGLSEAQCWGSNADKNSLTHLRWEDMPGVIICPEADGMYDEVFGNLDAWGLAEGFTFREEGGPMTAREVLQFMGTEIFRKMYGQVWVDSCIRTIKKEGVGLAIITDCRFPNEVKGVQDAGGKVVRFKRAPFAGEDEHESETALDPDVFDWEQFDAVIDNVDMTIPEQNGELFKLLREWNYISDNEEEAYAAQAQL